MTNTVKLLLACPSQTNHAAREKMRFLYLFLFCVVTTLACPAGPVGRQGPVGPPGAPGVRGFNGTGIQGQIGQVGQRGPRGFNGTSFGVVGPTGQRGPRGFNGTNFPVPGPTGSQGPRGFNGSRGPIGLTGSQGQRGFNGSKGATGATGATGAAGGGASQSTLTVAVTFTGSWASHYSNPPEAVTLYLVKTGRQVALGIPSVYDGATAMQSPTTTWTMPDSTWLPSTVYFNSFLSTSSIHVPWAITTAAGGRALGVCSFTWGATANTYTLTFTQATEQPFSGISGNDGWDSATLMYVTDS